MDEHASEKVEPTQRERQKNREREVSKFNALHIGVVILTAIIIVVGGLLLIW